MLGGINIAPYEVPVQLTKTVKTAIIEELHESHTEENVKIDLQSKQNEGRVQIFEQNTPKAELSEGPLDDSSPMLESRQTHDLEVSEEKMECKVEDIDEIDNNVNDGEDLEEVSQQDSDADGGFDLDASKRETDDD